jgi:hypothetical protein
LGIALSSRLRPGSLRTTSALRADAMHARTTPVRFLLLLTLLSVLLQVGCTSRAPRVLVFTKTDGYRHGSIDAGIAALQEIGAQNGFVVDTTEQASAFTEQNLQNYAAVVFLNTSGDVLD